MKGATCAPPRRPGTSAALEAIGKKCIEGPEGPIQIFVPVVNPFIGFYRPAVELYLDVWIQTRDAVNAIHRASSMSGPFVSLRTLERAIFTSQSSLAPMVIRPASPLQSSGH